MDIFFGDGALDGGGLDGGGLDGAGRDGGGPDGRRWGIPGPDRQCVDPMADSYAATSSVGFDPDGLDDEDPDSGHAAPGGPQEHLWMRTDDAIWDLGPADLDTDADGVDESLTRVGEGGMTIYTDSDSDGEVDLITAIDKNGQFESRTLDPETGGWKATDAGRLN